MLVVSLFTFVLPVTATAPIEPPLSSKEEMIEYATVQALQAKISPSTALTVIKCESSWNPKAIGDGGYSHGLVQIHSPSHPEISIEQAEDPKFAIDFLIYHLKAGNGNMWTCFRHIK